MQIKQNFYLLIRAKVISTEGQRYEEASDKQNKRDYNFVFR